MTKKDFTDTLFKAMYEFGYRKAEIVKGRILFYKEDTLMGVWVPRIPVECTCFADEQKYIDIGEYIGIVDWSKVPIDTPVLISNDKKIWFKRYFARYEDGKVYCWLNGKTSWTAECEFSTGHWDYAKLAEV